MKLTVAILAALTVGYAVAECPNACSGNGECVSKHDYCSCYSGFIGADCSERICPFGLSFIDTPVGDLDHDNEIGNTGHTVVPEWRMDGYYEQYPSELFTVANDEAHFYMECSNRGHCDRSSGQCQCFTGFTGAACNRTTCASDCSGHGLCKSIKELAPDGYYYELWDADKTMQCECDGGWGGIDCSMRLCMTNDDPLTSETTHIGYSAGLAERGEVQELEFRCPYNGKIVYPMARIVYTDAQFGDKYTTAAFDFTSDITAIEDALKGLPNQVLSDYVVDGIEKLKRLSGVTRTIVDADRHYLLNVEFHKSLGDVPALEIVPMYKCQGGAEVSINGDLIENIDADYIAEGPAQDLIFEITWTDDVTFDYQVLNAAGVSFGTAVTGNAAFDDYAVLPSAGTFTTEAEKVQLKLGGGSASVADRTGETVTVRIHTTPRVAVRSRAYTTMSPSVRAGTPDVEIVAPTYPYVTKTVASSTGGVTGVQLWIDGEFRGWVNLPSASLSLLYPGSSVTSLNTIPAAFLAQTRLYDSALAADQEQTVHVEAALKAEVNDNGDTLNVAVKAFDTTINGEFDLPTRSFRIIIKLISVDTSTDTFTWKLAGDSKWAHDINSVPSFVIPAAGFNQLPGLTMYLAEFEDDESRKQLEKVYIDWTNGVDFDDRICTGEKQYYYIEVGSEGLNDSPVCSDRGMCDFGTGECKCFKGYAGIDCSEQNALAGGSFSSSGL